jgi:pseudoazurin
MRREHTVKMLNDGKGEFMVFEPSFVQAAPGDTIKFVATDQMLNAETLAEIWPEGAATFQGEISKDVTLTVEKKGVYGVKCLPHYPMGMLALVAVDKPVNAAQVKAYQPPEMGKNRFEAARTPNPPHRHARPCVGHPRVSAVPPARRGWPGQARP